MKSNSEKYMLLGVLILLVASFAFGQINGGNITGFVSGEAWDFENSNTASDYMDVIWYSVGPGVMDFIVAFGIIFATMQMGLGMAFSKAGSALGGEQSKNPMTIFAVFGGIAGAWYINSNNIPFASFIGEYGIIIAVLILALMIGKIILAIKSHDEKNIGITLIAAGSAFLLMGISLIYVLDTGAAWGFLIAAAGLGAIIFGLVMKLKKPYDPNKPRYNSPNPSNPPITPQPTPALPSEIHPEFPGEPIPPTNSQEPHPEFPGEHIPPNNIPGTNQPTPQLERALKLTLEELLTLHMRIKNVSIDYTEFIKLLEKFNTKRKLFYGRPQILQFEEIIDKNFKLKQKNFEEIKLEFEKAERDIKIFRKAGGKIDQELIKHYEICKKDFTELYELYKIIYKEMEGAHLITP